MITRTSPVEATSGPRSAAEADESWRRVLADAITDLDELLDLLDLRPSQVDADKRAVGAFALRVPRPFVSLMTPGDPRDPLLLQVLPARAELSSAGGFCADPLGEKNLAPVPGLLHKYRGRALMVVTGACGVHCRYCFRRHFPYSDHAGDWGPALSYIGAEPSIQEVLLSGGDPLSLSDAKLSRLLAEIESIPHVKRLRIHTRMPVVVPNRVTPTLVDRLSHSPLQTVMVLHVNHCNELSKPLRKRLLHLKNADVLLLNQSVLLRNVNDSVDTLANLSEALFDNGILPYYLHVLDRVDGATHFEVSESEAKRLMRGLLASLPGYLVPKLVREQQGAPSKTPIGL